jgi:uncharacterized integral membrane protein
MSPSPKLPPLTRIENADAWLALIVRYLFAIAGLLVLAYDLRYMMDDPTEFRIVVALLAAAMMGRVVGATFAEIIRAWKGGGGE